MSSKLDELLERNRLFEGGRRTQVDGVHSTGRKR
jgi:hypothetical protein